MSPDPYEDPVYPEPETSPLNARNIIRVVRAYLPGILLSVAVVAVAYAIVACVLYLRAPSDRTTWQTFRLNFRGAGEGTYPNGIKFSSADIVSTPVLLRVFNENELGKFMTFPTLSRSIYVLEYNAMYESLAAEYQAKLADPKLTSVDRDRITEEFESKRASLLKNDYAIHFARTKETANMPDRLVRKILVDVLKTWANRAVREQHVLLYRVTMLSPQVVAPTPAEQNDLVAAVLVLRAKVNRVIAALDELDAMPGAELVRSRNGQMSIDEVRLRLEDINRFRLEPLVPLLRGTGAADARSRQFVEAQLAFDRRELDTQRNKVNAIRETLAAYSMSRKIMTPEVTANPQPARAPAERGEGQQTQQTIMPQISDNFLDRLVALANSTTDVTYRQRLTNELRAISDAVSPAEQAVAYDEELLRQLNGPAAGPTVDRAVVRAEIEAARKETGDLIRQLDDIHREISESLNPPTELYTTMGVPISRIDRAVNLGRLVGFGVLALLVTFVLATITALLHNYWHEEDEPKERAIARPAAT